MSWETAAVTKLGGSCCAERSDVFVAHGRLSPGTRRQEAALPRAQPHAATPENLSGLWHSLNPRLAGQRAGGERRAESQVGFARLGKGPPLPEALPAAQCLVRDRTEASTCLGACAPRRACCPNYIIVEQLSLQMRPSPKTSESKTS